MQEGNIFVWKYKLFLLSFCQDTYKMRVYVFFGMCILEAVVSRYSAELVVFYIYSTEAVLLMQSFNEAL